MALINRKANRHPYSFEVRAWSERLYLLHDDGTVSNFQYVLIAGLEIMGKCVVQKVARLNAKPLRGKNAPLKQGVLLAPSSCFAQPGASGAPLKQGNTGATHHYYATKWL